MTPSTDTIDHVRGNHPTTGGGILGNVFGNLLVECTPGYYNNEGKPLEQGERFIPVGGYPGGPVAYFDYIDDWRRTGDFKGPEFRVDGPATGAA